MLLIYTEQLYVSVFQMYMWYAMIYVHCTMYNEVNTFISGKRSAYLKWSRTDTELVCAAFKDYVNSDQGSCLPG